MSTDPLTPTLADVAALIRARTKDRSGDEIGTFSAETRPTDVQAQEAIAHAVTAVHEKVGRIDPDCQDVARLCAAYGAAAEIELSYFPEQARTERSPYNNLNARYKELLTGVEQCVLGNLPSAGAQALGTPFGHGTLQVNSAVVDDYYSGIRWPIRDRPHVEHYDKR